MVHLALIRTEDINYWTDHPVLQLKLGAFVKLKLSSGLKDPAVDADRLHLGVTRCHYQLKHIIFASTDLFDVAKT